MQQDTGCINQKYKVSTKQDTMCANQRTNTLHSKMSTKMQRIYTMKEVSCLKFKNLLLLLQDISLVHEILTIKTS